MVKDVPTLDDLMPKIKSVFEDSNEVVIYNADFDRGFFPDWLWRHIDVRCCMKEFIFLYSELEGHFSGKRFPLKKAYNVVTNRSIGEIGQSHRALSDCLACRDIWLWCMNKREIVDDPKWKTKGYEVYCGICKKKTFHKYRPRYRQEFDSYYQCTDCWEGNISKSEMETLATIKEQE
jgi:DNA polymerase III epsilon subunit-like protein